MAQLLSSLLFLLIVPAVPAMAVSVLCAVLGLTHRSRSYLVAAACLSIPMFLYILMGNAWWRPAIPFVVGMYFAAAYAVPRQKGLAVALVAPYFAFVAIVIGFIVFREPPAHHDRVEWRTSSP